MRRLWLMALAAASAATTGCVSVLPEAGPPPEIYRLDGAVTAPLARASAMSARTDWTVSVAEPLASRALSSDRIAVVTEGEGMSYAAGARWDERAPRVVQEQILRAFEDDGRVRAAVRPDDGVASAYEVRFDLMRFEAVYTDGAPTVEVALRAKLIDRASRELLAATRFSASRRAASNTLGAIVEAFDTALDETSDAIVSWTIMSATAELEEPASEPAQLSASAASSSK